MRQGLQLELQEMTCFLLEVEDVGSVKTILTQSWQLSFVCIVRLLSTKDYTRISIASKENVRLPKICKFQLINVNPFMDCLSTPWEYEVFLFLNNILSETTFLQHQKIISDKKEEVSEMEAGGNIFLVDFLL